MIILDEHLADPLLLAKIRLRYAKVTTIQDLGLRKIRDPDIPSRLSKLGCKWATFVTINSTDFWGKMDGNKELAVVCLDLRDNQKHLVPDCLRAVLVSRQLRKKKDRCGKIIRVQGCGTRDRCFWIRTKKSDVPTGPWRC